MEDLHAGVNFVNHSEIEITEADGDHARGRVVRAEAKSGGTLLTSELDVRVVDAEKPALLYRMQTLYR